jgi:glycosyltransferase involved in cell wall biosynthesis
MKISYGITVCNEHLELRALLNHLEKFIDNEDEILVLVDISKTTNEILDVLKEGKNKFNNFIVLETNLNGDFASFKNNLITHASGDFLFQIDADEIPSDHLLLNLKIVLEINNEPDAYYIPRVNRVIGITPEHIQKWKWNLDEQGRINFPDQQMRLFKLNKEIKWKNKVHEVLEGYKRISMFPYEDESWCLIHIKSIEKQEQQNIFYETI